MTDYTAWVTAHPIVSAMLQFALLGTLGEFLSHLMRTRTAKGFGGAWLLFGRMAAWGVLGLVIKVGFTGMKGFVAALVEHGMLPTACSGGIARALAVSVATNVFFGPQMMLFHRVEDNLLLRRSGFAGMRPALMTLLWFWIPAHTVTFALPSEYQIGLAAAWSVALGIILGLAGSRR